MNSNSQHLIIVAGEVSGDMHAAHLVMELKKLNPRLTFSAVGGPRMQAVGVELYADLTQLAVVGFVETWKHYNKFKKVFRMILEKAREVKPAAVILVDYPGFNLPLAQELKKSGIKVIYYISPQVWAWKENRVQKLADSTDKILVLFEFEKNFYAQRGVDVEFVGHPLVDSIRTTQSAENFLQAQGLLPGSPTVGLLPGSRLREVETLLPIMLKAAVILKESQNELQFLLIQSSSIPDEIIKRIVDAHQLPVRVIKNNTYNAVNASRVCMVASGTATLETALLNRPMVVVYKTLFTTWLIARLLIKIPYIGLVNVVAGKKIVPECIQFDATPKKIAAEIKTLLSNPTLFSEIQNEFKRVKSALGDSGASRRTAEAILANLTK